LDALHPGDRQRVGENWLRALKEKTPIESEHWVRDRDDRYRQLLNHVVPVFD
jgi:hypothetical protein